MLTNASMSGRISRRALTATCLSVRVWLSHHKQLPSMPARLRQPHQHSWWSSWIGEAKSGWWLNERTYRTRNLIEPASPKITPNLKTSQKQTRLTETMICNRLLFIKYKKNNQRSKNAMKLYFYANLKRCHLIIKLVLGFLQLTVTLDLCSGLWVSNKF